MMPITDLIPFRRNGKKVPVRRLTEEPILTLRNEMNRLFDEFFRDPFSLSPFEAFTSQLSNFTPRVDVVETDKEVKITAELPGVDEEDIDITLRSQVVTISGEKKEEKEEKGRDYYHYERSYGSFRRDIPLPCEVEEDKADATFKKGVLTITLPKTAEARRQVKRIKVRKV
jgi:HSP20 family protein